MTGDHSSKQYDTDLETIRSKVLLMGGIVEHQFREAMESFRVGDGEQAERVIAQDDAVNRLEVELDDACSHLIVRRQPTANDLRTVMATIKIITDLERVGDEATKIARTSLHLHKRGVGQIAHYETVRSIADVATDMLCGSLDALARLDAKQARDLIADDAIIDHGFRNITWKIRATFRPRSIRCGWPRRLSELAIMPRTLPNT
jgi:phosphate transport system protein